MFGNRSIFALVALACLSTTTPAADVTVNVDNADERQIWYGFGAEHHTLVYGGGAGDVLSTAQRNEALRLLHEEVGLTTGHLSSTVIEAPADSTLSNFWTNRGNDNNDPFVTNQSGYYRGLATLFKQKNHDPLSAAAKAEWNLLPNISINKNRQDWIFALKGTDYQRFLDELAEYAVVVVQDWTDRYGYEPEFALLANEPFSGNQEVGQVSDPDYPQIFVDITKACGARLSAAGIGTKLVIPAEETTSRSLTTAQAVLGDSVARQYVGALAYHTYPYGSNYSYIPNIITRSGTGNPASGEISIRAQLRDLAAAHGIQIWMNEVSNGFRQYYVSDDRKDWVLHNDFRAVRGRAIHIHDEMRYARVNAFYGMNAIWDLTSNRLHFEGREVPEEMIYTHDDVVLVNQDENWVRITGIGYAIGHYARWFGRGAQVIGANSDDALVQVTAVRDDSDAELVFVLINNASDTRNATLNLANVSVTGQISGERSIAPAAAGDTSTFWVPLAPFAPSANDRIAVSLPAQSVTTIAVPIGSEPPPVNVPPTVSLSAPADGASYTLGQNVAVTANASDSDGSITQVRFYAGATQIGSDSSAPYSISWTPSATGSYSLYARATDDDGADTDSAMRAITIDNVSEPGLPALTAHWTLDDGSGTTAVDSSGNGRSGTLSNGPQWIDGQIAGALAFDGNDDVVTVNDFPTPSSFSIEAWIRSDSAREEVIVCKHNDEYDLRIGTDGRLHGGFKSWRVNGTTDLFAALGTWRHVVLSFDAAGDTVAIYLDGALEAARNDVTGNPSNTSNSVRIGRHGQWNFAHFDGAIDDVRIYSGALNANQVQQRYDETAPPPALADFAINVGGGSYTAMDGTLYEADRGFIGGNTASTTAAIGGTEDDPIYQSVRYGDASYRFAVANGDYLLTLHFAELSWQESGARISDLLVEGVVVVDDLDIYDELRHRFASHDIMIPITIGDGTCDIEMRTVVDNAILSGIRLQPVAVQAQ